MPHTRIRRALVLSVLVFGEGCASSAGGPVSGSQGASVPAARPGSASAPATLPDPTPAVPAAVPQRPAIRVPASVTTFTLAGRRDFDIPGAGSAFRYVGPDSLYVDLHLYPGPDLGPSCDLVCAERVMSDEAKAFESIELPQTQEAGTIRSFELLAHDTLAAPEGAAWRIGRHLRVSLEYPDRPGTRRSDYYLYYLPDVRVKVRITYLETPQRTSEIDAFMRELLPALTSSGA